MSDEDYIPEEEIVVQTEDLCALMGGCDRCPGHAKAGDCGLSELDPEEYVLCTHWCHEIPSGTA
jgi:hypothetical protein